MSDMRSIIFYRVSPGIVDYDYVSPSTIEHLQKYNRLTLYEHTSRRASIRHTSNIFVAPDFINSKPLAGRIAFVYSIISILQTIPSHKPLHIDFNDYPELFIWLHHLLLETSSFILNSFGTVNGCSYNLHRYRLHQTHRQTLQHQATNVSHS